MKMFGKMVWYWKGVMERVNDKNDIFSSSSHIFCTPPVQYTFAKNHHLTFHVTHYKSLPVLFQHKTKKLATDNFIQKLKTFKHQQIQVRAYLSNVLSVLIFFAMLKLLTEGKGYTGCEVPFLMICHSQHFLLVTFSYSPFFEFFNVQ